MTFDINKWYLDFLNENTLLSYKGVFSTEIIDDLLDKVEKKLCKESNSTTKIKKRIIFVVIEILQNLYHHIETNIDSQEKTGIIVILKSGSNFKIITGNYLKNSNTPSLKKRLKMVNSLSHEEIRNLRIKVLAEDKMSKKGGAGLGFIDIVNKTKNKLTYKFIELNTTYSFFNLEITI